ncbi:sugar phosphate nucleotidyltransferase [Cohnella sp. GCM10027633]|uniref:sugar phosphate nucleotidyltransferase n=1 Tax=unclassified Cohnella TaxID=2636738 RepID=UPI003627A738
MKGLILGAGNGTRLMPFTRVTPKVLLPVANKPIVHYCIDKLVRLGIEEIGIVIQPAHKSSFMKQVGRGDQWPANIQYIYQYHPKGIADAVRLAGDFLGDDSFILLLGDNLIEDSLENLRDSIVVDRQEAALLIGAVANPRDYGIAEIEGERLVGLEEKPNQPKTNLAVLGAYAFGPRLLEAVRSIEPSARGEYEITDAIKWMLRENDPISCRITDREHSDVGRPDRWLIANRWMLEQSVRTGGPYERWTAAGCTIVEPVSIDDQAVLDNCTIGPYASIGAHVRLTDCTVQDSIVLAGYGAMNETIRQAIVSPRHSYYMNRLEASR